jgi:hypothetical protein
MLRLVAISLGSGLLWMILTPIVVFFLVAMLGYALDPRCSGGGDSGGCAMGAASIGLFSAIPGFLIGAGIPLCRAYRRRGK